jgi:hypothetical protein
MKGSSDRPRTTPGGQLLWTPIIPDPVGRNKRPKARPGLRSLAGAEPSPSGLFARALVALPRQEFWEATLHTAAH